MRHPADVLRWLIAIAGILAVGVGWLAFDVYHASGQGKTLEPHFDGTCVAVRGLDGPEDLTIHPRSGIAFISAADRWAAFGGKPRPGAIFAYDLASQQPRLRNLTAGSDSVFLAHGLSLWVSDTGPDRLVVVDHTLDAGVLEHRIVAFDWQADRLEPVRTLRDPLLVSPNDVVAVDRERFYVTNDHDRPMGTVRMLTDLLRLGTGSVVYYDGSSFREVASGIPYANGINLSEDGRTVSVASTNTGVLYLYDRDLESGELSLRETQAFGTGLDNIERDAAGNWWIGAHPKLLAFLSHASDPTALSPSQVLRVTPQGDAREIYLDLGDPISGSSVAAVWRDHLLIGAVFADHFLHCRMVPGA